MTIKNIDPTSLFLLIVGIKGNINKYPTASVAAENIVSICMLGKPICPALYVIAKKIVHEEPQITIKL